MIITGCSSWTLYTEENYRGNRRCWKSFGTNKCDPSFYVNTRKMNGWEKQVKSVRKGCFSNAIVYRESLLFDESDSYVYQKNKTMVLA